MNKRIAVLHLLGWLLVFLFFFWVFWGEGGGHYQPINMALIALLVCLPIFYSHFYLLFHFGNGRKLLLYLAGLFLILATGPFLFLLGFGSVSEGGSSFPVPYIPFAVLTLGLIILGWIARVLEVWFINALKRESLEKQSMRAELAYLKSQINPHFLFNTLNNIHTLAYKQSPATPEAIMRLSSLMRYMLYEANSDTVALHREVEYLEDFINLQQLRYKQAPIVAFTLKGDTESCRIPPLLFIHLLENAYKHSPAQLEAGAIKLGLEVRGNSLTFTLQNPVGPAKKQALEEAGGIGLANVQKRLQLLYPNQHSFDIDRSDALFRVILKIHRLQKQDHAGETNMLHRG